MSYKFNPFTGTFDADTGALGSGITQLTGDVAAGPGSGSQVATIQPNAVNGSKFRLNNNQYIRARNAANSADLNLLYVTIGDFFVLEDGLGQVSVGVTDRVLTDDNSIVAITYKALTRQLNFPTATDYAVDWTTEAIVKVGGDLQMHPSPQTTVAPILSLSNDADTESVSIQAPAALAASYSLILPPDDGSASQVLTTDGSGVLSWTTPGSGSGITQLTGDATAGPGSGSQVLTIAANAVTGSKMRLNNNESFRARNAANSADVNLFKLNSGNFFTLLDGSGVNSVGVTSRALVDEIATQVVEWSTSSRRLNFPSGTAAFNFTTEGIAKVPAELQILPELFSGTASSASFFDDAAAFKAKIKAPSSLAASYTLVLPPDDGTANQLLTTDGSGNLSWSTNGSLEIETRTISSGENTAKQLTLAFTPSSPTKVLLSIAGAPTQYYGLDYTVSGNILSWSTLALDGILTTGDNVIIEYNL